MEKVNVFTLKNIAHNKFNSMRKQLCIIFMCMLPNGALSCSVSVIFSAAVHKCVGKCGIFIATERILCYNTTAFAQDIRQAGGPIIVYPVQIQKKRGGTLRRMMPPSGDNESSLRRISGEGESREEMAMSELPKKGIFYVKDDPELGEIRGLDPWAVENGIHISSMQPEMTEGIMMINSSNSQQYGTVHGGVLVAFADSVGGHSLAACGKMVVTQSSTVNFIRPAAGRYILCRARPVKVGRRACVVSVEQTNDKGEVVTTALFTYVPIKDIEPVLVADEGRKIGAD